MQLSLRQRRKLRELEVQFDVKDTATLVAACNNSRDNQEQHDAFLDWIENYVRSFEKLSISDSHQQAMEFVNLADIKVDGARTKELLRTAFCCLCSKIRDNNYGEKKLTLALCYFLLSVDCQAFQGNPHHLTRLARDVIAKLGHEATFSRGTYPTHSVSLFALHHLCAVIHEIDPTELDHGKRNGLFQLLDQCLQNIINTQSYYPFCYQAMLTRQSLASMDSNRGTSSKEIWYRLFHALRGVALFYQALAEVATLKIDVGSFDKSVEELTEAFAQHNIKSQDWFETVKELIHFRMLVQKDPEELENFKDCLEKVDEILENTTNKEDQLALRYTMIRQVTLLALDSPSKKAREWAVEELFDFGTSRAQRKGWIEDVRTLEALLDAMLEIHQNTEFADRMERVINHMKFYFRTTKQNKTITNWMNDTRWREEKEKISNSKYQNCVDILFQKVKAELSIDESISTSDKVHHELQEKYLRDSEVPSLFDNEVSKHVQTFQHSLMLHQKVHKNNGDEKVETMPIDLEELFKDRESFSQKKDERIKQVLLFGNPGTGKTTIAKKIAYLWSVGEWGDLFESLYLVPVRELVSTNYDDLSTRTRKNLQTAITNICFSGKNDDEYELIKLQVEEDLDKDSTLVVFDGFDEGEKMTKEIMKSLESKSCRVLVLSRPWNLQSKKDSFNVEVECVGMNEWQLIEFFELETSSFELEYHLKRHPPIWKISHVPVVANILTFLYKTKKESIISEESSLDMFSLYWKMSLTLWDRYVDKTESEVDRNKIFEALEEIAFNALEGGQILIAQDSLHEISHNLQMRNVLKGCGFLLLRKEGLVYQFPHLTFQEFFAGQYMAQSLMGNDDTRKQRAIDFLAEHKYCENLRQMLRFMIQACIVKKGDRGYHEIELFIDAIPIALGYEQHLVLKLELLEAALSTSKRRDSERILNSTKVLEIAFEHSRRIIWKNREFSNNPLVPLRTANILASIIDCNESYFFFVDNLFEKVVKVARYDPIQWEKIIKMLQSHTKSERNNVVRRCRFVVKSSIPIEARNVGMFPWTDSDSDDECSQKATVEVDSKIDRALPDPLPRIQEVSNHLVIGESVISPTSSEELEQEEKVNDLDYEIGDMFEETNYEFGDLPKEIDYEFGDVPNVTSFEIGGLSTETNYKSGDVSEETDWVTGNSFKKTDHSPQLSKLGFRKTLFVYKLFKKIQEKKWDVKKLIQEWCDDDPEKKCELIHSCKGRMGRDLESTRGVFEILWTLCEDDVHRVRNEARKELASPLWLRREKEDSVVNGLLMLSENEPHSCRSTLLQLFTIAYDWIEGTHEDLNRIFSNLSQEYIQVVYEEVTHSIAFRYIGKQKQQIEKLHMLHLLCIKALQPPDIEENELFKTIEEADFFPDRVVVMSTKLLSIPLCQSRVGAPLALRKLASMWPKYKEDVLDILEQFTEDDDDEVAINACIATMFIFGKEPQRIERTMCRLESLIQTYDCYKFFKIVPRVVSFEEMVRAYIECPSELPIPLILMRLRDVPATIETRSNGLTRLIVHLSSDSKETYSFKTSEDAEVFRSIFRKCTERRFQEVASSILY